MPTVILILQKKGLCDPNDENPKHQESALAKKTDEEPVTYHTVVSNFSFRENE